MCAGISSGVWQAGREATRANNIQLQPSPAGLLRPDQSKGCSCFCALTLSSRRDAVVRTPWFLFLKDSALWLQGSLPPSTLPRLSKKLHAAQKHQHFCSYSPRSFSFFFFLFVFLRRVCVMFTSLESKAFLLADGRMVTWQGLHLIFTCVDKRQKARQSKHPQIQVKGWNKCNVHCCTIFSNKRTQNLFAIVFIWTLPDFSLFLPCPGSGVSCNLVTCIPFFFFWPYSFIFPPCALISICICTTSLFLSCTYSSSVSLSSVPAECEHIWETLLAFTNVDKFSKRLNSCTMLLQSKQNTFQSLLQFCKKCVHFCFFASH